MKKLLAFAIAALFVLGAAGCGGNPSSTAPAPAPSDTAPAPSSDAPKELTVLKVAASPAPHAEILTAAKEAMAAQGFDLQIGRASCRERVCLSV